jgi:hypothetical protein
VAKDADGRVESSIWVTANAGKRARGTIQAQGRRFQRHQARTSIRLVHRPGSYLVIDTKDRSRARTRAGSRLMQWRASAPGSDRRIFERAVGLASGALAAGFVLVFLLGSFSHETPGPVVPMGVDVAAATIDEPSIEGSGDPPRGEIETSVEARTVTNQGAERDRTRDGGGRGDALAGAGVAGSGRGSGSSKSSAEGSSTGNTSGASSGSGSGGSGGSGTGGSGGSGTGGSGGSGTGGSGSSGSGGSGSGDSGGGSTGGSDAGPGGAGPGGGSGGGGDGGGSVGGGGGGG